MAMGWKFMDTGYPQHAGFDGCHKYVLVWLFCGKWYLDVGWKLLDTGYPQHATVNGNSGNSVIC
jgi:hypothetical protein